MPYDKQVGQLLQTNCAATWATFGKKGLKVRKACILHRSMVQKTPFTNVEPFRRSELSGPTSPGAAASVLEPRMSRG